MSIWQTVKNLLSGKKSNTQITTKIPCNCNCTTTAAPIINTPLDEMKKSKELFVMLDNGHGENTAGKRSPDGKFREYAYCREIVAMLKNELDKLGIESYVLVPETTDVALSTRVQRANAKYAEMKKTKNCVLLSIHNNAAPGTGWSNASGWSGWVSNNASNNSKVFAQLLYAECIKHKLQGNRSVPPERYWSANFYIIKNTKMPAVLTENLFQTNKNEVDWLLSDEGKRTIVQLHIDAIKNYIAYLSQN